MNNVLINNAELYDGKYVATRSFIDKDVICSGDDIVQVYNEAQRSGVKDPVVFYIPEKDMIHIYKMQCL